MMLREESPFNLEQICMNAPITISLECIRRYGLGCINRIISELQLLSRKEKLSIVDEATSLDDHMFERMLDNREAAGQKIPCDKELRCWCAESYAIRNLVVKFRTVNDCLRFHHHYGLEHLKEYLHLAKPLLGKDHRLISIGEALANKPELWTNVSEA